MPTHNVAEKEGVARTGVVPMNGKFSFSPVLDARKWLSSATARDVTCCCLGAGRGGCACVSSKPVVELTGRYRPPRMPRAYSACRESWLDARAARHEQSAWRLHRSTGSHQPTARLCHAECHCLCAAPDPRVSGREVSCVCVVVLAPWPLIVGGQLRHGSFLSFYENRSRIRSHEPVSHQTYKLSELRPPQVCKF